MSLLAMDFQMIGLLTQTTGDHNCPSMPPRVFEVNALGAVVVVPEYSLAPEAPFPCALNQVDLVIF